MLTISVEAICYKVRPLRDNTYPLMLRLTQHRKRKYVSLGVSVLEKDWDFKKNQPKKSCPDREAIVKLISDKVSAYNSLIMELTAKQQEFTMSSLIQVLENRTKIQTVGEMYGCIIDELRKSDRLGNMDVYKYSRDSLLKFNRTLDIPFSDIDCQWLEKYEKWLRHNGCKDTTVSQLFRTLRSVFNRALSMKLIRQDIYPFNDFKVSKFDVRTKKRAVSKEDVKKIMSLDLSGERQYMQLARDIFLFSYFGAGINFSDIALLRYCDISEGRIRYIRKKTGKEISFPLSNAGMEIIQRYSKPDATSEDFIFPILDRKIHKTEMQRKNRIHKVIGKVNPRLAEIGKMAGLETHLTTYVARHTFATVLKRSGVSIAIISESMGHSDIATTQIYLDSFENSQIDEAMKNLLWTLQSNSNQSNQRQRAGAISCPFLYTRQPLNTITMNSTSFTPYQRNELKGMTNAQLVSLIRTAAENFPDTSLILTPRIDQSGQAYYWTGLRYGGTIELDFALLLNREIEGFVLSFLIGGSQGLVDIGNCNPDPDMTRGIDWLQCHQYRHIEYAQTVRDFIRTSNGRTFQNRKLTFPHGSIVYSQEINDVFSVQPQWRTRIHIIETWGHPDKGHPPALS